MFRTILRSLKNIFGSAKRKKLKTKRPSRHLTKKAKRPSPRHKKGNLKKPTVPQSKIKSTLFKKKVAAENARKAVAEPKKEGILTGEITHFFSRIEVVVIKITKGELKIGDRIKIQGPSTDFVQKIQSLQIESKNVNSVHKGQLAGLKVKKAARVGDKVYKL